MCQVRDDEFEETLLKGKLPLSNRKCNKCDELAIILIGTNGKFCRECFNAYFIHKFKAALGKHGNVRYGDKVLFAYSAGPNSASLLHLLSTELSPSNPKKLKFSCDILFVDDTAFLGKDILSVDNVKKILEQSGFSHYIIKLNDLFNSTNCDNQTKDEFMKKWENVKTLTSKEELLNKLRTRVIAEKALQMGYQHVFMAENSTRLAINILANVSQGKGAHISADTAFCDSKRFPGINILRPLRDISGKEIAVFNAIHKIESVTIPTITTGLQPSCSIKRLTEEFVLGLTKNFPATEPTIYRTANKIQCPMHVTSYCTLCGGMMDSSISVLPTTAEDALHFTQHLSNGIYGSSLNSMFCLENADKNNVSTNQNGLCHSCLILKQEFIGDENDFSVFLKQGEEKKIEKLSTSDMEKQLSEFLIQDDNAS